jgi:hypothetical protein
MIVERIAFQDKHFLKPMIWKVVASALARLLRRIKLTCSPQDDFENRFDPRR